MDLTPEAFAEMSSKHRLFLMGSHLSKNDAQCTERLVKKVTAVKQMQLYSSGLISLI
jgi:ABC-type Fe2+-enterobactin transport system substrate-binding protein